MIRQINRFEMRCDGCDYRLLGEHLNAEFHDLNKLIDYATEGGWIVLPNDICYCDECRKKFHDENKY